MFGQDALIRLTCNPQLTNFHSPNYFGYAKSGTRGWDRVAHVMLPKDYVRFRLTGDRAIDMADASGTLLLDVATRRWSAEVLGKTGIEERMLPALYESPQVCGRVSTAGAEATGLRAGTPGRGFSWRSGGGRRWHGHSARGRSLRHDRNFRCRFCRNGSSGARSAGAVAYVLSRDPWTVARHGRNSGGRVVVALVS